MKLRSSAHIRLQAGGLEAPHSHRPRRYLRGLRRGGAAPFCRVSPAPLRKRPLPLLQRPLLARTAAGAGADPSNGDEGAEDAESAHLDPEQLKTLTNAKLAELAKEMGIDTAKLKTKAQLIAAITDVPLEDAIAEDDDGVDDGEAPPVLTPEAPVV